MSGAEPTSRPPYQRLTPNEANPAQVTAPERDPGRFAPVFLLAPARSHSSVVATMIGRHPELYGFPELGLWRQAFVGRLIVDPPDWFGPPASIRRSGLLRTLAELHEGAQTEETVVEAFRWLRRRLHWTPADLYDYLQGLVAPRVAVEKTPDNSGRDDNLERLAAAYPRARFLHLTRHPVTSELSMIEAWRGKPWWAMPPPVFPMFCMGSWFFHHRRIEAFCAGLEPERTLRVRSEDVLTGTDELARICRWLGVDDGPAALEEMRHPERSPFTGMGPPGANGGNDPKFLSDPVLRPPRLPTTLDIPADWVVDPWVFAATVELAGRFGYAEAG